MDTTASLFAITFDERSVVALGSDLLDVKPEHAFPCSFGTSVTQIINRDYPRLDAFGNFSMTYGLTTAHKFRDPEQAWAALYAWVDEWKTAGKGTFLWEDGLGHQQLFEAVINSAEPRIVDTYLVISYDFTLGRPL